jgi:hypothetical protein
MGASEGLFGGVLVERSAVAVVVLVKRGSSCFREREGDRESTNWRPVRAQVSKDA